MKTCIRYVYLPIDERAAAVAVLFVPVGTVATSVQLPPDSRCNCTVEPACVPLVL